MPRSSYWILDTTTVESIPTLAPAPRGAVPSLNRLCSLSCRGRMQPASDHAAGSMQKFGLLSFLPPSTPLHALLTNKLPLRARLGFLATRRSACFRRARTIHGGSRAARRLDRHQDLRAPRPLAHPPAATGALVVLGLMPYRIDIYRGLRVDLEHNAGSGDQLDQLADRGS